MDYISVKNLDNYQHYKDRHIVWIKWHLSCYQDYIFNQLDPAQKWFFIGIIGLACKCSNKIPKDYDYISRILGGDSKTVAIAVEKMLAIKLLSSCYTHKIREDKIREDKIDIVSPKGENHTPVYEIPKEPLGKLVVAWKILQGVDMADRSWDKAHWGRTAKSAKQLLDFFGGDYRIAGECMSEIKKKMDKLHLTCTIETILNHSTEWKVKNEQIASQN